MPTKIIAPSYIDAKKIRCNLFDTGIKSTVIPYTGVVLAYCEPCDNRLPGIIAKYNAHTDDVTDWDCEFLNGAI